MSVAIQAQDYGELSETELFDDEEPEWEEYVAIRDSTKDEGDSCEHGAENLVFEEGVRRNAEGEQRFSTPIWDPDEDDEDSVGDSDSEDKALTDNDDENEATLYEASPAAAIANVAPLHGSKQVHLGLVMLSKPTAILGQFELLGSPLASSYAPQIPSCRKALCDCNWGEFKAPIRGWFHGWEKENSGMEKSEMVERLVHHVGGVFQKELRSLPGKRMCEL